MSLADDERAYPVVGLSLADQLAAEGLVAGVLLVPERRLPLGGPVVVKIGGARIALGREVAHRVMVRGVPDVGVRAPRESAP